MMLGGSDQSLPSHSQSLAPPLVVRGFSANEVDSEIDCRGFSHSKIINASSSFMPSADRWIMDFEETSVLNRRRHQKIYDSHPMMKKPTSGQDDFVTWEERESSVLVSSSQRSPILKDADKSFNGVMSTTNPVRQQKTSSIFDPAKGQETLARLPSLSNQEHTKHDDIKTQAACLQQLQTPNRLSSLRLRTGAVGSKSRIGREAFSRFQVSLYVKKFISRITKHSQAYVFRNVKGNPFRFGHDLTYSYEDYLRQLEASNHHDQARTLFDLSLAKYIEYLSRLSMVGTINPDSLPKFLFDIVTFLVILLNIVYLPIMMSFNGTFNLLESQFVEYASMWFIVLEIFVNMSTQYYDRTEIVADRIRVFKHYLQTRAWLDTIVALPFVIGIMIPELSLLKLFYLLRLSDFANIMNKMEKKLISSNNQFGDSLRCILLIILVAHFSACTIYYISLFPRGPNEKCYLDLAEVDETIWFQVYMYSFYWSIITMTTIGYGDIRPYSHRERIYATFFSLISCVVFGFTLNQIGSIMANLYRNSAALRRREAIMDAFMKKRKLSPALMLKVRKNLEFAQKDNFEEEHNIVQSVVTCLTSSLRNELSQELYAGLITSVKTFNANFSHSFVADLSLQFKEFIVAQEDQVFTENDAPNKLFFIIGGEVELFFKGRQCSTIIGKNQILGLEEFLMQIPREIEAKTSRTTTLAYLEFNDFLDVLHRHPSDFETYRMILDGWQLYGATSRVPIRCINCQEYFHSISKCPYLFFNVDRIAVLNRHNSNRFGNTRTGVTRKSRSPLSHAYIIQMRVWEAVYKIFENEEFRDFLEGHQQLAMYFYTEAVSGEEEDDQSDDDDNTDSDEHSGSSISNEQQSKHSPVIANDCTSVLLQYKAAAQSEGSSGGGGGDGSGGILKQEKLKLITKMRRSGVSKVVCKQIQAAGSCQIQGGNRNSSSSINSSSSKSMEFQSDNVLEDQKSPLNEMRDSSNEHFRTLRQELKRLKVGETINISSAIEKKNPLMQRFFGGENRSELSIDLTKQQPESLMQSSSLRVPSTPSSIKPSMLFPLEFKSQFNGEGSNHQVVASAMETSIPLQEIALKQAHLFSFNIDHQLLESSQNSPNTAEPDNLFPGWGSHSNIANSIPYANGNAQVNAFSSALSINKSSAEDNIFRDTPPTQVQRINATDSDKSEQTSLSVEVNRLLQQQNLRKSIVIRSARNAQTNPLGIDSNPQLKNSNITNNNQLDVQFDLQMSSEATVAAAAASESMNVEPRRRSQSGEVSEKEGDAEQLLSNQIILKVSNNEKGRSKYRSSRKIQTEVDQKQNPSRQKKFHQSKILSLTYQPVQNSPLLKKSSSVAPAAATATELASQTSNNYQDTSRGSSTAIAGLSPLEIRTKSRKNTFRNFCKAKLQNESSDAKKQQISNFLIERPNKYKQQQQLLTMWKIPLATQAQINSGSTNATSPKGMNAIFASPMNRDSLSQSFDLNEPIALPQLQRNYHSAKQPAKKVSTNIWGDQILPQMFGAHPVEGVYEKQLNLNKRIVNQNFFKPSQDASLFPGGYNQLSPQIVQQQSQTRHAINLNNSSSSSGGAIGKQLQYRLQQQELSPSRHSRTNSFNPQLLPSMASIQSTFLRKNSSIPLVHYASKSEVAQSETQEEQPFFLLSDFDVMKLFKVYFPFNNYNKVLKNFSAFRKKRKLQASTAGGGGGSGITPRKTLNGFFAKHSIKKQ